MIMVMCDISRSWDKEKNLDSQTRLLTGVFFSSYHAVYHFYDIEIHIFLYEIVNFAIFTKGLITMLRHNWHSYM